MIHLIQLGKGLSSRNPNGVVKPGDVIYLLNGNHGDVRITGCINSNFITVQAYPGHTPVLNTLTLGGACNWAFKGLTIQSLNPTGSLGYRLVIITGGYWGPTSNIYLAGNHICSQADVSNWSQSDWLAHASSGISVYADASNISFIGNDIQHVRVAVGLAGPNALFQNNLINNYGDDAIDYTASNIAIIGNTITNNRDVGDGIHCDCMQGWNVNNVPVRNIEINGNLCIAAANPNLPFLSPATQGIDNFSGVDFADIRVTNNVVIVPAWHGITFVGAKDVQIINNTVMGTVPLRKNLDSSLLILRWLTCSQ